MQDQRDLFEVCSRNRDQLFPTRLAEKQGQMTSSALTTLRYRCHVECPSMGKTMASPKSKGKDPITRAAATKRPHIAIVIGFASTTRTDVRTAVAKPTSRSRSSGTAHHADSQRHDREEEANAATHDYEGPAGGSGENLADELRTRRRHPAAEG